MEPTWIKSKWKQVVRVTLRYLERDAQFAPDSSGRVGMWRWTSLRKTISVASHSSLFSALPPLRITRCCFIPLRWSGFFCGFWSTRLLLHFPLSSFSPFAHPSQERRHTFSPNRPYIFWKGYPLPKYHHHRPLHSRQGRHTRRPFFLFRNRKVYLVWFNIELQAICKKSEDKCCCLEVSIF